MDTYTLFNIQFSIKCETSNSPDTCWNTFPPMTEKWKKDKLKKLRNCV